MEKQLNFYLHEKMLMKVLFDG